MATKVSWKGIKGSKNGNNDDLSLNKIDQNKDLNKM